MKKKIVALIIFTVVGFIFLQVPFWDLVGSNQKYSLFDFLAPGMGMFLASWWGGLSVVAVKFFNVIISGQSFDAATIIRLFPLAFAALYFGARRHKKIVSLIPLACMALFVMHPEGRAAWYYSLYWLIPFVASFTKKSLVFNGLGATFTAHAIGGVGYLYAFNLPSEVWIALIPIVFLERIIFTCGITLCYIVFNSLASFLARRLRLPSLERFIKPEYTLSRQLLSNL